MMIDKRLINQVDDAKKYIGIIIFINWIGLICNIFITFNIAYIFNYLFNGYSFFEVLKNFYIILIFVVIKIFCNILAGKLAYNTSVKVKKVLREKIYTKLLSIGSSYNEKVSTSEVVQVSVEGVEQLEIYFSRYLPQLFYSLIAPITLFFVITPISFISALVLLICVPLIPISIIAVQKFAKKLFSKYWGDYTSLGDDFLDKLQGLTTLKIYDVDKEKNEEMNVLAQKFRKITMRVLIMQLNSVSLMDLLAFGGAAIGVILAVTQLINGNIDMIGAIVIILLAAEFFIPLRLLGSFFHIAMNGMSASKKIFKIIDIEDKKQNIETISNGDISIKNMSFSYENRKILSDINIDVKKNSLTALVGQSGCGKSTIASLIMSFKQGYEGEILIDNKDVKNINEKSLMKNVTLVNHNSYIFKGTVEENLKMAKKDASKQEMEQALKDVNFFDFIKNNGGLSFKLEERGANISGGQCQRLALARAILHDSKVYIFDEATSNIDVESEKIIMDNIYKLAKTKTVLLISHRLANVALADYIYVLDNGKIVESGNHSQLIENKKTYFKLYNSQQNLEKYTMEVSKWEKAE